MTFIVEPGPQIGKTRGQMLKEVFVRGFDDFEGDPEKEAQMVTWMNQAYQEVTLAKDWPFLEAEYEGKLPFTFTNLGHVLDVVSVQNRNNLTPADRRELVRFDPTLQGNGQVAERWFREGAEAIQTYPLSTSETFRVRYSVFPEELATEEAKPIVPTRFQYLIVLGTVAQAYMSRDAYSAAELVEARVTKGLAQMTKALMSPNHDRNLKILRTQGNNGYGFISGWSGY